MQVSNVSLNYSRLLHTPNYYYAARINTYAKVSMTDIHWKSKVPIIALYKWMGSKLPSQMAYLCSYLNVTPDFFQKFKHMLALLTFQS